MQKYRITLVLFIPKMLPKLFSIVSVFLQNVEQPHCHYFEEILLQTLKLIKRNKCRHKNKNKLLFIYNLTSFSLK